MGRQCRKLLTASPAFLNSAAVNLSKRLSCLSGNKLEALNPRWPGSCRRLCSGKKSQARLFGSSLTWSTIREFDSQTNGVSSFSALRALSLIAETEERQHSVPAEAVFDDPAHFRNGCHSRASRNGSAGIAVLLRACLIGVAGGRAGRGLARHRSPRGSARRTRQRVGAPRPPGRTRRVGAAQHRWPTP